MVRLVFNRRHRHVSDPLSEASSAATVASWHFSDSGELGPCPVRVKSDGLAVGQSLLVYPYQQTFSDADGMFQRCQRSRHSRRLAYGPRKAGASPANFGFSQLAVGIC
jgi:hypothetical protein